MMKNYCKMTGRVLLVMTLLMGGVVLLSLEKYETV